jgi:hypothetical protein
LGDYFKNLSKLFLSLLELSLAALLETFTLVDIGLLLDLSYLKLLSAELLICKL